MRDIEATISNALKPLIGLPLSIARNAGNMKVLPFWEHTATPQWKGHFGEYALHIQCPWRIVQAGKILTGSQDFFEEQLDQPDESARESERNLQEKNLFQTFAGIRS